MNLLTVRDPDQKCSNLYGSYNWPETYIIDHGGTIRFKYVGPMMPDVWKDKILPVVQELNRQGTSK